MHTLSYDEKPGIQAIATTGEDRPPIPNTDKTVAINAITTMSGWVPSLCLQRLILSLPKHLSPKAGLSVCGSSPFCSLVNSGHLEARLPNMENLFLLVISMLALDCFRYVRFAWIHIISKITNKPLNSFYYSLEHGSFDHLRWPSVTARLALCVIPSSLKDMAVFLSIDDTVVEKYRTKESSKLELATDMVALPCLQSVR